MQGAKWSALRDAWRAAGDAGIDSLWTEDHLLADAGDWRQAKFEGWAALAALGPLTQTPRGGVLVTAVAFRNPGHWVWVPVISSASTKRSASTLESPRVRGLTGSTKRWA